MSAFHSIYLLPFESALRDEVRNQIVTVFYNLLSGSAVSVLPHLLYGVRLCITTGCVCVCVFRVKCWDFGPRGIVHSLKDHL